MIPIQDIYDEINENEDIPQLIRVPVLLMSALVFQGIIYMDRTERVLKICMTLVISVVLKRVFGSGSRGWIESLVFSHLLNFLFNGHPWAFVNHTLESKPIDSSPEDFENWSQRLEYLGNNFDSIAAVAVYGSHSRGQQNKASDLDVRVIRYPGAMNGLISSLLVCRERAFASLSLFPIDIYLLDRTESLSRLRDDEEPKILVDKESWL